MKKVFKQILTVVLVMLCVSITSCTKVDGNDPSIPDEPIVPINPDEPTHPQDNGYAKLRLEITSDWKEHCDFRYYKLNFQITGDCSNANMSFEDRTTESIKDTPWVYETEVCYHGDTHILATFDCKYDGESSNIFDVKTNMKLYCNDELVVDDDMIVFCMLTYNLPYVSFNL